jgi:hypothetical protein
MDFVELMKKICDEFEYYYISFIPQETNVIISIIATEDYNDGMTPDNNKLEINYDLIRDNSIVINLIKQKIDKMFD